MPYASGLTRRQVLTNLAVLSGASFVPDRLFAFPGSAIQEVEQGLRSLSAPHTAVPLKVQPFPLTAVRLRPGPFQEAMEINRRYLHSIPNDRLLHTFRVTAGLPSSAEPLHGWEDPGMPNFLGHFAGGHYLSACALTYASTGDETLKAKADALVAELAKCQTAMNADGLLASFPASTTEPAVVKSYTVNIPFYISHKVLAGHIDMYLHCGNTQALATAEGMGRWLEKFFQKVSDEDWTAIKMFEYGAIAEPLFSLYAITGKKKYLTLARKFDHKVFFDPLIEHRDALTGLHGNTHILVLPVGMKS